MIENHDPHLQDLFSAAQQDLGNGAFAVSVERRARKSTYRILAAGLTTLAVILLVAWQLFAIPLQEFTFLVAQGLTMSLFEVGEGWLAWIVTPINNVASLLVVTLKGVRVAQKKVSAATLRD